MFFESKISLMPKNDIEIGKKVPTKVFGKFLNALTFGATSEDEQRMTKTAVNILQQLNIALMKMNITNLVRLSKNGFDFYLDQSGKDNDLKDAMLNFKHENPGVPKKLFDTLFLVVEHEDEHLKYLIEIDIDRVTTPGQDPIQITVNGLVKEFGHTGDDSAVKDKMRAFFEQSDSYEQFVESHKLIFSDFTDRLVVEIKKAIACENIDHQTKTNIFTNNKPAYTTGLHSRSGPLFSRGYYGYDDSSFYTWLWMDFLIDNHYIIHDVEILDDYARPIQYIGSEGVEAEKCSAIECDKDDYVPEAHQYINDDNQSTDDTNSSSSWLSSSSNDSYTSSDDSSSSCSSSSCSSCSSGCGGD